MSETTTATTTKKTEIAPAAPIAAKDVTVQAEGDVTVATKGKKGKI